jgi:N-acetylglucosaminyldiphosphoundecaprenol N-acetyl-beta-D-mannosaminyltransferase
MVDILGVKIDNLSREETLEKISGFLTDGKFHQIATVGPEFILEAQKNEEYKNILNNCNLNVADGFGIKCAFWRYGKKLKSRFAGVDLMQEILKIAEDRGLGVFLACRKDGLSNFQETKEAILKIYPGLIINGANLNPHPASEVESTLSLRERGLEGEGKNDYYKLQTINYKLILCNFGAPYQEIFLNSLKNDTIGIAMGVGGSFDFITGKVKRAPKFMRQIGLEWLWRLIKQPNRWKRIWNAVIVFPIKIILDKKIT